MATIGRSIGRLVVGLLRWSGWRDLLARLPLPMLALAASYGVYSFALLFVPPWIAVVQAMAFELVYIGLAVVNLPAEQRRRAQAISIGAVVVSVAYNTLDGLFHRRPGLLAAPDLWLDVALSLLHGVPLAVLAYLVADLLLHHNPAAFRPSQPAPKSFGGLLAGGRPSAYTLDGLVESLAEVASWTREELIARLGCSESTADRLLADGVSSGRLVRLARGSYRVVS